MRRVGFLKRVGLLALLLVQIICAQAKVTDLRLAIIWNSDVTPYKDNIPLGYTMQSQTIGKTTLKLLLHSIDPTSINYDGSRTDDFSGINDTRYSRSEEIVIGKKDALPNVRVYNHSSTHKFSVDELTKDFDGKKPNAIVYINAGAEWDSPELATLLKESASKGISVLTIGDDAAAAAAKLDPSGDIFAVKGVQRSFTFMGYTSDLAAGHKEVYSEFDFVGNDDVADTVLLKDNAGKPAMYRIEGVTFDSDKGYSWTNEILLFTAANLSTSSATSTEASGWSSGVSKSNDVKFNIIGNEWKITAKAVDVIPFDTYSPGMNFGVAYRTAYIGWDGSTVRLGNSGDVTTNRVVIGGALIADYTNASKRNLVGLSEFNGTFTYTPSGDGVKVTQDVIATVGSQKYLFIAKDTYIEKLDEANYNGTWHQYTAGGYAKLAIATNSSQTVLKGNGDATFNNPELFKRIFPTSIKSGDSLIFKQWNATGRVQAAADIWAINSDKQLVPFDSIYDVNHTFSMDNYYYGVLGNQIAVDSNATTGGQLFYKTAATGYFETKPFGTLPGSSVSGTDKKLFHAVSAIQHGYNRIMMLGFQPQYLDNVDLVKKTIADATLWVGVNDVFFPEPSITAFYKGSTVTGDAVHADLDSIRVELDMNTVGTELYDQNFSIKALVKYDGKTYTLPDVSYNGGGDRNRKYTYKLSDFKDGSTSFSIDRTKRNALKLEFEVQVVPGNAPMKSGRFMGNSSKKSYDIRKLQLLKDKNDGDTFTGTETVRFWVDKDQFGDVNTKSGLTVSTKVDGVNNNSSTNGDVTVTINNTATISATASKNDYIDAEPVSLTLERTEITLPKVTFTPTGSTSNSAKEYFFYADTAVFLGLEKYSDAGLPITNSDYDISYSGGLTGTLPDTGKLAITLAQIDGLINGTSKLQKLEIRARAKSTNAAWLDGSETTESYDFRTVSLQQEIISKDLTLDSIEVKVTVWDSTNGWNKELTDADVFYNANGTATVTSSKVKSGTTFKVKNGSIVSVLGNRTGYIAKNGQVLLTKEPTVLVDSETAFGDSLGLTFTSNVSPFKVKVTNVSNTVVLDTTISATDGKYTLTDARLNDLVGRDTSAVKVDITVEKNGQINGFTKQVTYTHRRLPSVVALPSASVSNAKGTRYLFDGTDASVAINLKSPVAENGDYSIEAAVNGATQKLSVSGETVTIPLASVETLIAAKATSIPVTAGALATRTYGPNSWMNGKAMSAENYGFRALKVNVTRVGTEKDLDFTKSVLLKFEAVDSLDNERVITGDKIIVVTDNISKKTFAVSSGDTLRFTSDVEISTVATKRGWISSSDAQKTTYTRLVDLSQGAAYFDANADGIIDSAVIRVDTMIVPDSIVCQDPFSATTATVTAAAIKGSGTTLTFALPKATPFGFGTGFDPAQHIALFGRNYGGAKVSTVDSVAPVIVNASVIPEYRYIVNGQSVLNDTLPRLTVKFSEPMDAATLKVKNPFRLTTVRNTIVNDTHIPELIADSLKEVGTDRTEYRFVVKTWGTGVSYPQKVDSISLNDTAKVSDGKGVAQDVRNNRKVPLAVTAKTPTVEVLWLDLNIRQDDSKIWGSVVTPLTNSGVQSDSAGILIILDPKIDFGSDQFEMIKAQITIYDQIGNKIVSVKGSGEGVINDKQIQGSIISVNLMNGDKAVTRQGAIGLFWNLRNSVGRLVGPGAYKVLITSNWPDAPAVESSVMVQVGKKKE